MNASSKERSELKSAVNASERNIPGMERSFAILDSIAANPSRVVDVTNELDLPWATVHRTIKKLERAQFIVRDPKSNRYEIGPRMWHIGSAYLANNRMMNAAISYLATEPDIKDVDIQIVERIGNYSVVTHAEKRQARHISKSQYGFHIPLHAGSKGHILLAYEDKKFVEEYLARKLEPLTPDTITDPVRLAEKLKEVRKQGWALTVGDVQNFTGSISAPIFNESGAIAGCACFIFLKKLVSQKARLEELQEQLALMTHSISTELGWRPGHNEV